jgi:hypothetical protein
MSPRAAPVLFLDFDGVLHSVLSDNGPLFQSLALIEALVRRHPSVPIVLSTDWRTLFLFEELKDRFSSDIRPRVVGVTPVLQPNLDSRFPVPLSKKRRQREIEAWLFANRTLIHPWIAVDDRPGWFEPECPNLLVTNRITGFTEPDVGRLESMIQSRYS